MKHKGNRPVNRARPGRDARRERALNFFCGAAGILTFLALWQLGATYSRFGRFIPGPIEVIPKFFLSFTQPIGVKRMGGHILASLARVAAEMLAAQKGLGYMIQTNRMLANADNILVGMLLIGVIGAIFSLILGLLEKQLAKGR